MSTPLQYQPKDEQTLKWLIVALFVLSWGSIKISLPALPRLAYVFHTNVDHLKLSVTLFFIFYAISQAVWGSFSEYVGRRKIILLGLVVTFIGSIVAACARDVTFYVIGRCLEGVGMGSISPVCRAMLADIYDRKQVANVMGLISLTIANMPVIAPLIGGYLVVYVGWRAIFVFFAMLSFGYFVVVYKKLPETIQIKRDQLTAKKFVIDYLYLIKQKTFWGYTLCYAFLSGFILGYYAAMPFWFVTHFGVKENHYAYFAFFNVGAYIAGILFSRKLLTKHFEPNNLIFLASFLTIFSAITAMIAAAFFPSTIFSVIVLMAIFTFSGGALFSNATAGNLITYKHIAGPVSALMTTVMFLMAGLASWIASNLSVDTLWPLAFYITLAAVGCLFSAVVLLWRQVDAPL